MKNQLQQRECNRWKVSALKEKNEKLKSFKDISSKECREKETLGTKGHVFQRTNTKWWLLRLILVIINLPGKNQEFFSHSNRETSRECLASDLSTTIFIVKTHLSHVIKERKHDPTMLHPIEMLFKYKKSPKHEKTQEIHYPWELFEKLCIGVNKE